MSLKITNKNGKVVAKLEDDWSEPEIIVDIDKQEEVVEELEESETTEVEE